MIVTTRLSDLRPRPACRGYRIRRRTTLALCAVGLVQPGSGGLFAQPVDPFKFAYPVTPVAFANGDIILSGGLLVPSGPGPFPAVILVHGAGPGLFDEPAFCIHANAFVRAGFAVLTYDKTSAGRESREAT
jgi:hypothetical protein